MKMSDPAVTVLTLTGDHDRAQAVAFLNEAIETSSDELRRRRLRWVREYVIKDQEMPDAVAVEKKIPGWVVILAAVAALAFLGIYGAILAVRATT